MKQIKAAVEELRLRMPHLSFAAAWHKLQKEEPDPFDFAEARDARTRLALRYFLDSREQQGKLRLDCRFLGELKRSNAYLRFLE